MMSDTPGFQYMRQALDLLDELVDPLLDTVCKSRVVAWKKTVRTGLDNMATDLAIPARTFVDDLGRRWEWCGGEPDTWAWRMTAGSDRLAEVREIATRALTDYVDDGEPVLAQAILDALNRKDSDG